MKLKSYLPRGKIAAGFGFLLLLLHSATPASVEAASDNTTGTGISAQELNHSINRVLNQPEFSWRLPREKPSVEETAEESLLGNITRWIFDTLEGWCKAAAQQIKKLLEWLDNYLSRFLNQRAPDRSGSGIGWMTMVQVLVFTLLALVACTLALMLYRMWKQRKKQPEEVISEAIQPPTDLADENIDASEMPEDSWLTLAGELMEKGELRLALRAFYLAGLAYLAQNVVITIAKFKSNHDYLQEMRRRANKDPHMHHAFSENIILFERAWYGMHEVTRAVMSSFIANHERIRSCVK